MIGFLLIFVFVIGFMFLVPITTIAVLIFAFLGGEYSCFYFILIFTFLLDGIIFHRRKKTL